MEFQLPPSHEGERSAPLSASSRKNSNSRPFQGKLRGPSDCLCTNRPYCTRAGPFQGKFHRHVRLLARQLSSTASAQGCSGKNFTSPKTTAQQTAPRPRPIRRHNARRPVQPFWSNFASHQDSPPVSSTPSRPRRATSGKTSQGRKLLPDRRHNSLPCQPSPLHSRRTTPGKTSRPGRLPLYRPIPSRPRRAISGKTPQAHQDSPPVSSTPPHPRRATSEKTSQGRKLLPDRRHNSLPCQPSPLHSRRTTPGKTSRPGRLPLYRPIPSRPRRVISGEISQACQTARLSAQPHRIRAGLLREKLHKPKNHSAADGPKATPHQTTQRSPTRPTILVKLRGP